MTRIKEPRCDSCVHQDLTTVCDEYMKCTKRKYVVLREMSGGKCSDYERDVKRLVID